MNRWALVAGVVAAQAVLTTVAVAPQVSARVVGDTYQLRVEPVDPVDPFRGAYVALGYPDLRTEAAREWEGGGLGTMPDDETGDVFISLRPDGDVMVASAWSRERPTDDPYLACTDVGWEVRCGIESWFVPQDEALEIERMLGDGAVAEVRIDGRGNAAITDLRDP